MDERISHVPQADGRAAVPDRMRSASRKHMGVATSDPTYLPPVNNPHAPKKDRKTRVPVRKTSYGSGGSAQNSTSPRRPGGNIPPSSPTLQVRSHEGGSNITPGRNYISQPKKGHAIFTSREDRQRKRMRGVLLVLVLVAVALAAAWFFLLK
ncbi:MAG: hypothetical protein Q4B77_00660 [Coriobacteriaceae bacterium]|nr:hypothetical protein [Coriobacteriaceae bacterium]